MNYVQKILLCALLPATFLSAPRAGAETLKFGPFGDVTVYRGTNPKAGAAIFVSGDGGWNLGVVEMARRIQSDSGALVLGVDIRTYLKAIDRSSASCTSVAGDFEALSQYAQKSLGMPRYVPPVLVGYSSGATLVYAALVEAPPNTFAGAISMGFCPDLQIHKPLCKGEGDLRWTDLPHGHGVSFLPVAQLHAPWHVLQGEVDKVCDSPSTAAYVKSIGGATLVPLTKVGHGFSVEKNWMPQFLGSFRKLAGPPPAAPRSAAVPAPALPIVEVPARNGVKRPYFAIVLSGDGGWAGIDRSIGNDLADAGVPVVGFNSLQYFWQERTPDELGRDLALLIRHCQQRYSLEDFALIGYSRGADVLPFAARRLPPDLLEHVRVVALLGPGEEANFEFRLTDWLGTSRKGLPILPEVKALKGVKVLCVRGDSEQESLCAKIAKQASEQTLHGGHHFGGGYHQIAERILEEASRL